MKILIVNEYLEYQGAEEIVKKQYGILSKNNDVYLLTFNDGRKNAESFYTKKYRIIEISYVFKMFFSVFDYCRIRKYIKSINPDLIILHNIFSSPITVYRSIKGFKAIQIVHDYKIICPTSRCVREKDKKTCDGYKFRACFRECGIDENKVKLFFQLKMVAKCERLRKKNIQLFISPSDTLNQYLKRYDYNSIVVNNPIEFDKKFHLQKHNKCNDKLKLLYMGAIRKDKGVEELLSTLIKSKIDFEIDLYGKVDKNYDLSKLYKYSNIKFKGEKNHDELMMLLKNYDYLVVPSMWLENYPTTVLEAMVNGIVVLGSNRGGIVELLSHSRGILYQYGDDDSLLNALKKINEMTQNEYEAIRINAFKYVTNNNNVALYESRLIDSVNYMIGN